MSDRLCIINPEFEKYIIIGKSYGNGYNLGNVPIFKNFLKESNDWDGLEIVKEGVIPENYKNYNESGEWVEYE